MFSEEFIRVLIKDCSIAGDDAAVTILVDELNSILNPVVEKRHRAPGNKSGYVQVDIETGEEIARYATIKEANAAMQRKEGASCISQACRNFKSGKSQKAYGFNWFYGDDFDAQ